METNKLVITLGALLFAGVSWYAYNEHQNLANSRVLAQKSQIQMQKQANKQMRLVNETGKGVIYLAPKEKTAKEDEDAQILETILTKMFSYKDPDQFKENAEYVKPRVTGSFPAYWYKGGIEANYKELKLQAQGRKNERFVKKMTITKYGEGHYYAKAESGVLTGTTKESNIEPDEYGLEIKKRNGKWAIERIKGLESMNNNGN